MSTPPETLQPAPKPLDYTTAVDPLALSQWIDSMNRHLAGLGLAICRKLLTDADLMIRLSVPKAVARKILNMHADVQCGRTWRMSEERYQECVRNHRFRTGH